VPCACLRIRTFLEDIQRSCAVALWMKRVHMCIMWPKHHSLEGGIWENWIQGIKPPKTKIAVATNSLPLLPQICALFPLSLHMQDGVHWGTSEAYTEPHPAAPSTAVPIRRKGEGGRGGERERERSEIPWSCVCNCTRLPPPPLGRED